MAAPDETGEDVFLPGGSIRQDLLTQETIAALEEAVRMARETRWDSVRSPHIFMGLLAVPNASVRDWGQRLRADPSKLLEQFQELFHQEDGEKEPMLHLN